MHPIVVPENAKAGSLFAGLTGAEKESLLKGGRLRKCPKGQMVFLHGDPVAHFYIIVQGAIQLFRETADGQEKTIHIIEAGQTMCEGEILDTCITHRMSAVAIDDTSIMEFPAAWLKDSARKLGTFALNLLSLIAQEAYMAEIEAEHQASMSAPQLVACFLQRLCVLHDFDPKGFDLPYSKSLIASRLGMELETFSRTLAKLRENGITVSGTHVSINDQQLLEEYVCQMCSVAEECTTHQSMNKKAGAVSDKKTG
jgi:CRP/FNR family transcriptional regulator, dissimilatory nitrate respiration regulator